MMERLRKLVADWKTIDGSGSLCDKFKQIMNSLYFLSSVGGSQEGVVTREENRTHTEVNPMQF